VLPIRDSFSRARGSRSAGKRTTHKKGTPRSFQPATKQPVLWRTRRSTSNPTPKKKRVSTEVKSASPTPGGSFRRKTGCPVARTKQKRALARDSRGKKSARIESATIRLWVERGPFGSEKEPRGGAAGLEKASQEPPKKGAPEDPLGGRPPKRNRWPGAHARCPRWRAPCRTCRKRGAGKVQPSGESTRISTTTLKRESNCRGKTL